jgi:hypothetical protein
MDESGYHERFHYYEPQDRRRNVYHNEDSTVNFYVMFGVDRVYGD